MFAGKSPSLLVLPYLLWKTTLDSSENMVMEKLCRAGKDLSRPLQPPLKAVVKSNIREDTGQTPVRSVLHSLCSH